MDRLLKIENISYDVYDPTSGEKVQILKDVSLDIHRGEIFGIVGESGCGKTTLAKLIALILKYNSGRIDYYFNSPSDKKAKPAQILFQNSEDLINPIRSVKNMLEDSNASEKSIEAVMAETGVDSILLDKLGYQLSGGERQRIGLARILLTEPELLILDEPFSAQDYPSKNNFIELIRKFNADGNLTTIIITHEINLIENLVDRIAVMYGGRIVEISQTQKFFSSPGHPYSKFLLESGRYLLERKNIFIEDNGFESPCNYFNRCEQRKDDCLRVLAKTGSDDQIVYCNHAGVL